MGAVRQVAPTEAFVSPDSVLAKMAREMLKAHGGDSPAEDMVICPVCGEPLPCTAGRAAAEVVEAAGLAESSGLIAAARGVPGASPLGLPATATQQATVALPPSASPAPRPSPSLSPSPSFS